ncbi:isochorismatase family protein [Kineococcus aurantiacus]|uniref:Nicotinamidase-related amidase n=1 Tax=Kineococcus aurantiacus TaxID=37633 RepID=A0A7Y9DLB4_9ACTN|nr:nicotinamidase-related amidase [Kineococcus aurantiacus]
MTAPRRALVVVDVQQEYFTGPLRIQHPDPDHALGNVVRAVAAARAHDVPVVVVRHVDPAGAPVFAQGSPGAELHPALAAVVEPGDERVEKSFSSVFAGTGLADRLRRRGVDTVGIVGFMTNNCDLASAVEAEGLGFTAEVLSDASGAIDLDNDAGHVPAPVVHATLMALLHSNFAAVATTDAWIAAVGRAEALPKDNLLDSAARGRARVDA